MFSGIVEEMAILTGMEQEQENIHFTLRCSFTDELKIDQSIAHNGVCLTVVRIKDDTYTVTAMKETLERSNLGLLQVGDRVNRLQNASTWKMQTEAPISLLNTLTTMK